MENFTAYNPTKLHFGKGVVETLGTAASSFGKKALIVYGKGSVLKNGSYDATVKQLKQNNIDIIEFNGIKPNPVINDVDDAAALGVKEKVDMVVAVGGGSVIDSAKVIAICIADQVNGWQIMKGEKAPVSSLPLIAVLTIAATGTEMNMVSVLQNHDTNEKIGFRNPLMYPTHSFLDPTYYQTVPENYTAYGIVDLIAHSLEAWFGKGQADLSDKFVISIIREAMEIGPALMKDLYNYEYRERIMWAATCALNDTTMHGRISGDWGVHALGHTLSYLYDSAHGATLSIFFPAWMQYIGNKYPERVIELGEKLFNEHTVKGTVKAFKALFSELGSPISLEEAGIKSDRKGEILQLMETTKASGLHFILSSGDRKNILELV